MCKLVAFGLCNVIWILESWKSVLPVESRFWALESGIQLKESGI